MLAVKRACSAPWIENPYRLVSLWEVLMGANDEFWFGRIANVIFFLGRLESGVPVSQVDAIQMAVVAKYCQEELRRFGFPVSARSIGDVIEILEGTHPSSNIHDYSTVFRANLMTELESTLFLHVGFSEARYYREPRRDWEEVISRFPDAVSDIEESGKCYALGRNAASVFHSVQIVEHGLLALGTFMRVADPKSGFTAVASALENIKRKKYTDLSDFEQKNFAFFEQMHGSVHALKDAWRNKVYHAQGKLAVMTADFSPAVAIEIYMATRGFMRRLATDLPKKGRFRS